MRQRAGQGGDTSDAQHVLVPANMLHVREPLEASLRALQVNRARTTERRRHVVSRYRVLPQVLEQK